LTKNCLAGKLIKKGKIELILLYFVRLFGEICFSCMLEFCPRVIILERFIN